MNPLPNTRTIQQFCDPCATIEECYDHMAAMKQMPGHVFSYLLPDKLQVVLIFECISDGGPLLKNQAYVDLGEPIYAGSLPPTHGLTQVSIDCKEVTASGEAVGTYTLVVPLIPARPVNPLGENRFLVTLTELDVPAALLPIMANRRLVLEINMIGSKLELKLIRGRPRPLIQFTKIHSPVTEPMYPRRG